MFINHLLTGMILQVLHPIGKWLLTYLQMGYIGVITRLLPFY